VASGGDLSGLPGNFLPEREDGAEEGDGIGHPGGVHRLRDCPDQHVADVLGLVIVPVDEGEMNLAGEQEGSASAVLGRCV